MSERFEIDCYGIIDNWKRPYGDCRDKLSWVELCDILNQLDDIADDKFDNYEYVVGLEYKNKLLENKLHQILSLIIEIEDNLHYMKRISDIE